MSAVESVPLEIVEEEEVMSKEEVLNFLIAIGVNTCNRSYDLEQKELKSSFLEMSLKNIAPTWDKLDDAVKIAVLDAHIDEFKVWVNGG
jgi:hypothetical protein